MRLLYYKIKNFFSPRRNALDLDEILNPPSWRERQIQNQAIDKRYEDSLMAKKPHWSDKYDKDFKKMEKEVVRVIENG